MRLYFHFNIKNFHQQTKRRIRDTQILPWICLLQTLLNQPKAKQWHMTDYSHLTLIESTTMALLVVVTNFAGIPTVLKVFQKGTCNFLALMFLMSMICSSLYHLCEIYSLSLYLDELQWHRLDNVFSITSIELMILYICGVLHAPHSHIMEYSTLISSILLQEKDPWNEIYTILPPAVYFLIGLGYRCKNRKKFIVTYLYKNILIAVILFVVGVAFMIDGLDDKNDYLRFSHGMWHLSICAFSWFAFTGVNVRLAGKPRNQSVIYEGTPGEQQEEEQEYLNYSQTNSQSF